MVGHIAESSQIIAIDFRAGNVAPATDNLTFIEQCKSALPEGVVLKRIRIDAAGYQHEIIDQCIDEEVEFAIRAKMCGSLREIILEAKHWEPRVSSSGEIIEGEEVCRVLHIMTNSHHAFEVVIQRKEIKGQQELELLSDDCTETVTMGSYLYRAIATNSKRSDHEVIDWYNQRAEDSENRIKELKCDFGAEKLPCSDFDANALYFSLCALAYNAFVLLKAIIPPKFQQARAKRLRLNLYTMAGKLVNTGRRTYLKVQAHCYELLEEVLQRILLYSPSQ